MRRVTVALSSAGRRVELMRCFREDAAALGMEARLLALDADPDLSPACQLADGCFRVPPCTDETFIPSLGRLAREVGIDLLVPTIDTELPIFAAGKGHLERECGVRQVVVSAPAAVALARDKYQLMLALSACGVPVPATARATDAPGRDRGLQGPVILKPANGSASRGIRRLPSAEALTEAERVPEYVVQQLLDGPEYTVNVFLGPSGELETAVPHRRLAVRQGEVSKAVTERNPLLIEQAQSLARMLAPLGARGPLCFQAILQDGAPRVFEVNARFGGGYPLTHRSGAHFTRRLLEWALGLPRSPLEQWHDGVLMLRYDRSVFRERAEQEGARQSDSVGSLSAGASAPPVAGGPSMPG